MSKFKRIYASDFETTSLANLEKDGYVRVYLWSLVSLDGKYKYHGYNIKTWLDKVNELRCDLIFFHNLRFDGSFIVDYLVRTRREYGKDFEIIVDGMNIWYQIIIHLEDTDVTIWDSLKKFPGQSVKSLAKMYGIPEKLEPPYFDRYLPIDYQPYKEEIDYCIRDSEIIAYALNEQFKQGFTGMTLSSDAFKSVQSTIGGYMGWRAKMPKLSPETDALIRESYKGGWVYVNPLYQNIELDNITVFDVNSLYPWVMKMCELPWGQPQITHNKPLNSYQYVVRFTANFDIKKDHLPTVQIKHNPLYPETEYLTNVYDNPVLTMTNVDYELFKDHYNVYDEDIICYYSIKKRTGLLADYIDYWMNEKIIASKKHDEARRYLAKRYLNSPYGKTGMRPDRINKVPILDDDGDIKYVPEQTMTDGIYVPYASFVCAQARNKTIRSAQKHYDQFIYADTDSIHMLGTDFSGLEIDPYKLGYWKLEGKFEKGKYIRPKTYIHADRNYNVQEIKCAGMPDNIKETCTWDMFKDGQEFNGKIMQKRVPGGVVLVPTTYKIQELVI